LLKKKRITEYKHINKQFFFFIFVRMDEARSIESKNVMSLIFSYNTYLFSVRISFKAVVWVKGERTKDDTSS